MPVMRANGKPFVAAAVPTPVVESKPKKRGGGSTKPKAPPFDINGLGRLRNAHFQHFLGGMSSSAFHERRRKGEIPPPDGYDPRPWWSTETIRNFLKSRQ